MRSRGEVVRPSIRMPKSVYEKLCTLSKEMGYTNEQTFMKDILKAAAFGEWTESESTES